jgi:hypothetical protein
VLDVIRLRGVHLLLLDQMVDSVFSEGIFKAVMLETDFWGAVNPQTAERIPFIVLVPFRVDGAAATIVEHEPTLELSDRLSTSEVTTF